MWRKQEHISFEMQQYLQTNGFYQFKGKKNQQLRDNYHIFTQLLSQWAWDKRLWQLFLSFI